MRTGTVNLPLHFGTTPAWLFDRMCKLAREIIIAIVSDFGPEKLLINLSNPLWFQAFGCLLGFDWHSSGLTTTTCGAIKEAVKSLENDLNFFVAGGKGKVSRKTPDEITKKSFQSSLNDSEDLVYASKMSAKVDNSAVQDGYQLYHHSFFFTKNGQWAVVQQGMNGRAGWARRYHWLSFKLKDFVQEPHTAICSDKKNLTLNLVSQKSKSTREIVPQLAKEKPEKIVHQIIKIKNYKLSTHHRLFIQDLNPKSIKRILLSTYERQPADFRTLLEIKGVGPKTLRALSLISELIYGSKISYQDPAKFSFAHGGKDGYPYPVNRQVYDQSISILHRALQQSKIGRTEKIEAFRRLATFER